MGLQLRIWRSLGIAVVAASATAAVASAHGERSQEGFLRMETVAFSDVSFSTLSLRQGEQLTITWACHRPPTVAYVASRAEDRVCQRRRTRTGHAHAGPPGQWCRDAGCLFAEQGR